MTLKHILLILLSSLALQATDVDTGKFLFHLNGEWSVFKNKDGAYIAEQHQEKSSRTFIVSVYEIDSSEKILETMVSLRSYLENLSQDDAMLKKETDFIPYETKNEAPFDYIAYTVKGQDGFFTSATLGSSFGVILITYEGNGNYKNGVKELKSILDKMKVK